MLKYRHIVLCFALSACTVGPDYQEPAVFENAQIAQALKLTGRDLSISEQWYRQFNDDCLNTLIAASLNNSPTIKSGIEKLRQGKTQLFHYSWVGDYPDAENFLQLFYSKNIGGCNRIGFSDPEYDRMFEEILPMPDSPERTEKYKAMVRYLAEQVPWVFEGFPIAYQLNHGWLENYIPNDFVFSKWKYLNVDPEKREALRSTFKPLSFAELNAQ